MTDLHELVRAYLHALSNGPRSKEAELKKLLEEAVSSLAPTTPPQSPSGG